MSEFENKEQNSPLENSQTSEYVTEASKADEATSTVFSAPKEHTKERKTGKHKTLVTIICCVLSLAVLVGAVFGIKEWIPEKQQEEVSSFSPTKVYSFNVVNLEELEIKYEGVQLNITSQIVTENGEQVQKWSLKGFDDELINQESLSQLASYITTVTSYSEYETDELAKYGLDNPKVTVIGRGTELGELSLGFGNTTADGAYCYTSISTLPEKVYLTSVNVVQGFLIDEYDLAISTAIPAIEKTDSNASYFDEEGALSTFDTLIVSGANYPQRIVFKPNNSDSYNAYATFITTEPLNRIAANVETLRDLFGNSLATSSCVSFDQSAESLKKFGLDNPDCQVTIQLGGETYTYKFKSTEDQVGSYYVAASNDRLIRTVSSSKIEFINYSESDYYAGFMIIEAISEVNRFQMSGDVNADFGIVYDDEQEEYNITANGKEIVAKDFQDFYASFISTTAVDFNTVSAGNPALTVKLYHKNGEPETVLTFTKVSETRYQYTVGGHAMGQISSTSYKRLVDKAAELIK